MSINPPKTKESSLTQEIMTKKNGCPPQKIVSIGVAGGIAWFVMVASIGILILFAILGGLALLIIEDYWYWILFGIIGTSIIAVIIVMIMGGNCVANMLEEGKNAK